MIKDCNCFRLSGTVFWSKLDEKIDYSTMRVGINIDGTNKIFLSIGNPDNKTYELVKPGNKILVINGWLDTWVKKDDTSELQIKSYGYHSQFFPKEVVPVDINEVFIIGRLSSINGNIAKVDIRGEKNPKTNEYASRTIFVEIGEQYANSTGKRILLNGKVASNNEGTKSVPYLAVNYDKIFIF